MGSKMTTHGRLEEAKMLARSQVPIPLLPSFALMLQIAR